MDRQAIRNLGKGGRRVESFCRLRGRAVGLVRCLWMQDAPRGVEGRRGGSIHSCRGG